MKSIAIVGGGVIGWSVACRIVESHDFSKVSVTLISGEPSIATTSAVAAAYWAPYWIGDYDRSWASSTLAELQRLSTQPDADQMGLRSVSFREWLDDAGKKELSGELDDAFWWRDLPGVNFSWSDLPTPKKVEFPNLGLFSFNSEVRFQSIVARMPDYLRYLQRRATQTGRVQEERRWVDRLEDVLNRYDRVIHCTGWGAKRLASHDPDTAQMRLLAGYVVRVKPMPLDYAVSLHRGPFKYRPLYIVPRFGSESDAICGGTAIEVSEPVDPRLGYVVSEKEQCDQIHALCSALSPEIGGGVRCEDLVGLRPVRRTVRIEHDPEDRRMIHCYGHGGSGLTLSWGSADRVMELMKE